MLAIIQSICYFCSDGQAPMATRLPPMQNFWPLGGVPPMAANEKKIPHGHKTLKVINAPTPFICFVRKTPNNSRHWPPMAANGRQWPPMAANGRQWPLMGLRGPWPLVPADDMKPRVITVLPTTGVIIHEPWNFQSFADAAQKRDGDPVLMFPKS